MRFVNTFLATKRSRPFNFTTYRIANAAYYQNQVIIRWEYPVASPIEYILWDLT